MGDVALYAPRGTRPPALRAIAITGAALASGFVGATTNAVKGRVSPGDFVTILGVA